MARGSRKKAATNAATTSQGSLIGTHGAAPKKKTRRSDDEIEAALEAKLDAVRTRRKLAAIAGNKPLVAVVKAGKRLRSWLTDETYALVNAEISLIVEGNATWLADRDEVDVDDSDDDDGDAS